MAKEKSHIIACKNGVPVGYIKSVSYAGKKFTLTQNKMEAKGYVKLQVIEKEIDFLTSIGFVYGYTFMYD